MVLKHISYVLAVCLSTIAIFLIQERESLLAWFTLGLGIAGLVVSRRLQGKHLAVGMTAIVGLAGSSWALALFLVYSAWELGEVVEIGVSRDLVIRSWIVESGHQLAVIYDCPSGRQASLESANVVTLTRDNLQKSAKLRAVPVTRESEALAAVYRLYERKYAAQSWGTDVYYLSIGPRRGSQLYVLYLSPIES